MYTHYIRYMHIQIRMEYQDATWTWDYGTQDIGNLDNPKDARTTPCPTTKCAMTSMTSTKSRNMMIIDDHWFLKSDIAPYQIDTSYNSSFPPNKFLHKHHLDGSTMRPWWLCWTMLNLWHSTKLGQKYGSLVTSPTRVLRCFKSTSAWLSFYICSESPCFWAHLLENMSKNESSTLW